MATNALPVGILKKNGTRINPATDENSAAIVLALSGGEGSTANLRMELAYNSANNSIMYVGKAALTSLTSAAVWQIKRLDLTSGVSKKWCDGDDKFNNIWDNREALAYS